MSPSDFKGEIFRPLLRNIFPSTIFVQDTFSTQVKIDLRNRLVTGPFYGFSSLKGLVKTG